jgi:hypothetical protein
LLRRARNDDERRDDRCAHRSSVAPSLRLLWRKPQ